MSTHETTWDELHTAMAEFRHACIAEGLNPQREIRRLLERSVSVPAYTSASVQAPALVVVELARNASARTIASVVLDGEPRLQVRA